MIQHENGKFLLTTGDTCLLLRVDPYGLLELLHFGAPVTLADADALTLKPGLGWGASVLLKENDTASCPDVLALAWSGSGKGDYRESPLELDDRAADFRYGGFEILEGCANMESGLPQADAAEETLALILQQPGLKLTLYFSLFEGVVTRRAVLENIGDAPVSVRKLMSSCLDIPGDLRVTTFDGGWISEMRRHCQPVTQSRVVNESNTGFSSHRHHPGFLLHEDGATEDHGRVYGFNLIYSGNHYGSVQQSLQGFTRVLQGIRPARMTLLPGQKFETPEAVMTCSDNGFAGMSEKMHRFVNRHIIPVAWRGKMRPVLYNSWEGCMFDFNQHRLLHLAKKAKELGCELFVLDDGWFGKRNNDTAGLGDYTVNKKKLPSGLKGLSDRVHAMGLEFGLWFEPESVNPDSDLYRAHPDWVLAEEGEPLLSRHQLLLDLTKPEVRDYIVENVTAVLDSAAVSYVKWDMNRHSPALGVKAHDYILGLYDVLRRIFDTRPHILLESCASGGNRFDLGMLRFSPQIWCSDNTDPIERLTIQENLSYFYPQSTFGAHVSAAPHAQTLRTTPLHTRGNVSFFGILGYELDLNHLVDVEEKEIKAQIDLYKKYRKVFQFGTFRRLKNGWQVSDGKTVLAGVFHGCRPAVPGWEFLRLKDVEKAKTYRLSSRPKGLRVGQFGSLVKHVSPVELNPNGFILRTADRHYTLPDGVQTATVTGGALAAGVPLLPAFRGTGYDAAQRTQLDFGSDLYIVEEVVTNG